MNNGCENYNEMHDTSIRHYSIRHVQFFRDINMSANIIWTWLIININSAPFRNLIQD